MRTLPPLGPPRPPGPLPPLIVVTDVASCQGRSVLSVVAAAIAGGARAVLVRDKQLPRPERVLMAAQVRRLLDAAGQGVLLVASDPTIAADGVHLAADDPWPGDGAGPRLVGRSCHSSSELATAAGEGADYAFISPIFATRSKPGYGPALGPGALAGPPLPVWALGGITGAAEAAACMAAGASGVAVMGAVMGADDPSSVVAALLDALGHPARGD